MPELDRYYDHTAYRVFLVKLRCENPNYEMDRVAEFGGDIPPNEEHNEDYQPTVLNPTFVVIDAIHAGDITLETLKAEIQKDERAVEGNDEFVSAVEVFDANIKEYAIINVHSNRQSNIADARGYYY